MKIQWLGHACFLLTGQSGVRVLTDPFDEHVGYPLPAVAADIVTISHHHGDHDNTAVVQGRFSVYDSPGKFQAKGVEIFGLATYHDGEQGARRGRNTVFRLAVDGVAVVHCGDLGHLLSSEQVAALGKVDVLLAPVGGNYTIDSRQANALMRALQPAVTIPMHFKTPVIDFPIQPVDRFLQEAGGGRRAGSTEIELDPQRLAEPGEVVVLDYPE
jgi:L-ascorbate metabolism protein UlaG (beta-lactamase superfamily)